MQFTEAKNDKETAKNTSIYIHTGGEQETWQVQKGVISVKYGLTASEPSSLSYINIDIKSLNQLHQFIHSRYLHVHVYKLIIIIINLLGRSQHVNNAVECWNKIIKTSSINQGVDNEKLHCIIIYHLCVW